MKESPYLIRTREGLLEFARLVNEGSSFKNTYFRQDGDIDLAGLSWQPIGVFGTNSYFEGICDGNGHCVEVILLNIRIIVVRYWRRYK